MPELHRLLTSMETRSDAMHALLVFLITNFKDNDAKQGVVDRLQPRLPTIAYFSEYLRMPGQVSVQDLKSRQETGFLEEGDKIFLALLDMIGRTVNDLEQIDQHEILTAQLEGASDRVTQEIFQYWSQNQSLRVQFLLQRALPGDPPPYNDGWILRTRIQNLVQGDSTSFDERSAGMAWFFSFLVWFNQVRTYYGDNLIILLDDPGLSLHARAQGDLLRYIEERLAPSYQIIYTTHSPFMIDPTNLSRARTVENFVESVAMNAPPTASQGGSEGTKVGDDVLSTDQDTLFPLQAALGYGIAQSLAVSEHTLLVDGPPEILYLQWFKRKLAHLGRPTLDDRWVITPCGGVEKVAAFLSLFSGGGSGIAVVGRGSAGLESIDSEGKPTTLATLLKEGNVLDWGSYTGRTDAGNEDLIGRNGYLELSALSYGLSKDIVGNFPRAANDSTSLVAEVKAFIEAQSREAQIGDAQTLDTQARLPSGFDTYSPADYLIQQGMDFTVRDMDRALNRFQDLFKDLNSILDGNYVGAGVGRSNDQGRSGGWLGRFAFWRR
ncbi:MAG: hypothetical protein BZY88_01505 [SAR202 cluster bacterium Io17-Chloro-G9]|nr:MAG: hypothetical protein BZY88_01505 [SAR202 cluster bacterium Io17-Chloro-G9]